MNHIKPAVLVLALSIGNSVWAAQTATSGNYQPTVVDLPSQNLYKVIQASDASYGNSKETVADYGGGGDYGGSGGGDYGGGGGQQGYGGGGGGGYKQEEKYAHQPYGFGYNIDDGYGNKQWRHEKSGNPHQVTGSYGYKDKNGIMREVEYIADKNGFRAMIKTTEPGTAPKDPAYVKMNASPIQVEYYPPKQQSGYGKGGGGGGGYQQTPQGYSSGGGGDAYAANNYADSASGSGASYGKSGGDAGYGGKSMGGYDSEPATYSSPSGAKTTAKYQDKKKK